jgi:hypothetical protein
MLLLIREAGQPPLEPLPATRVDVEPVHNGILPGAAEGLQRADIGEACSGHRIR